LVDEVNADANARRAAATEMGALLHEGDPAKDDRPGT
jgi:hypothetical protein